MLAGVGPLASGTVVGRYRIDGPLGRGGMAIVYEATHESLGRQVALKLLAAELGSDPEFIERFRREGQMQASLEHPHIVTVYEAGASAHGLYLAMRLVRGPTLAALLLDGVVGAGRALDLLRQVAEALDAAAAAGLVHRDVKPKNVLVDEDHAYLADFGLTKLGGESGVTVTGQLIGTLAYLAPEIIRGDPATRASDVYSFAAMAFECLSGGPVFPRATQAAQLYAHTTEPPPLISRRRAALPAALDAVFERALAKHPSERPETAVALIDQVAAALDGVDLASLGPPPPPGPGVGAGGSADTTVEPVVLQPPAPPPARSRARTLALLAAGAAAGVLVTFAAVALTSADDPASPAAVAIPAALPGAVVLGSDLVAAGRTLDCRGGPVGPASTGCSILQSRLPRATLVVPSNGVIRRWAVRSARGELALSVLRPRNDSYFQLALSRSEFVGNDGVFVFDTDVAVERGDVLAVRVIAGSGVGVRAPVAGAATLRWIPRLRGTPRPSQAGPRAELLLRAELLPDMAPELPPQVKGSAAAGLPAGRVRRVIHMRYNNGRPAVLKLVDLPGRMALDLFRDGRRVARQQLPDFRPGSGRVVQMQVEPAEETEAEQIGITIDYANAGSTRILSHYVVAYGREFEYFN